MEQEESIQLVSHLPEDAENLQAMVKYLRSKSLPCVGIPPLGFSTYQNREGYLENVPGGAGGNRAHHSAVHHGKPPLAEIRENSEETEGGRSGGTRNSSIRSDNTNNTLLINDKMGSERSRGGINSIGQVRLHFFLFFVSTFIL